MNSQTLAKAAAEPRMPEPGKKSKLVFLLVGSRRRVGKDTFGKLLYDELQKWEYPVIAKSFAGALKDEINVAMEEVGGWPEQADAWTEDFILKEKVIRPLLIAWGNGRRHFNENHWVDKVYAAASTAHRTATQFNYRFVVVTDWRFPNEIKRLKFLNDNLVYGYHLSRASAPDGTPDEIENDPLCRKLANFQINNDGDHDSLKAVAVTQVQNLFADLFKK